MDLVIAFALSVCIFSFQVLLSPTISTIFAGSSLHLILAPAWLAFAASFLIWSFLPQGIRTKLATNSSIYVTTLSLVPLSVALSLWLIKFNQESLNQEVISQSHSLQPHLMEQVLFKSYDPFILPVTFSAALPFLFYGFFLSLLFARLSQEKIVMLISVELGGVLTGMVSAAALLELTGSWGVVASASFLAGGSAFLIWSLKRKSKTLTAGGMMILLIGCLCIPQYEPEMPANISARDFTFSKTVTELRKAWNSFSKVQTLEIQSGPEEKKKVISLGNGTGIAQLPKINSSLDDIPLPTTVQLSLALQPKKILVLFAGAGAELPAFERYSSQPVDITGVELNPTVVSQALAEKEQGLNTYLQRPHVALVTEDARTFLERAPSRYDLILFSWAGATVAHYSGAILHTTQYVLTRESLEAAIRDLQPEGFLVIMPGSKFNLLASLRHLQDAGQIQDLEKHVALVAFDKNPDWRRSWDDNVLVFGKSPLQPEILTHLQETAEKIQAKVVLAPNFKTDPDFDFQKLFMAAEDPWKVLSDVAQTTGLHFEDFTDDRPFVYHTSKDLPYLDFSFWSETLKRSSFSGLFKDRIAFLAGLSLFLTVIFVVGLGFSWRQSRSSFLPVAGAQISSVFIGIATNGLQLLFTYKILLFLGNPTYALIFSTVLWMGGSSLAAACVNRLLPHKFWFVTIVSFSFFLAFTAIKLFANPLLKHTLFEWPFYGRILLITLLTLPAVFGFGLLFPALLRVSHFFQESTIHKLIALDALSAAWSVLAIPLFAEEFGLSSVSMPLFLVLMISAVIFFFLNPKLEKGAYAHSR